MAPATGRLPKLVEPGSCELKTTKWLAQPGQLTYMNLVRMSIIIYNKNLIIII